MGVQRVASSSVVGLIQPGAEPEDQMAEEIFREQEGGPGLCAGEHGISIPPAGLAHRAHQQIAEQRTRQQDGEELHQADEEFLEVEVHESCALSFIYVVCPLLPYYSTFNHPQCASYVAERLSAPVLRT
jgi:hypothetical protein